MGLFNKFALATVGATLAAASFANAGTINFSGDARFRIQRDYYEHLGNAAGATAAGTVTSPAADNLYSRTRFRLKAEAQVNDELSATARFTTGSNQYSTHYTDGAKGGFGTHWAPWLDLAFLNYKFSETLNLQLGKVPVSFWTAGKEVTGTIWNFDQSFEGLQTTWVGDFGSFKPYAVATYASLLDRLQLHEATGVSGADIGSDISLLGIQVGTKWAADALAANLAIGTYVYSGIKGLPTAQATGLSSSLFSGARGNSLTGGTSFTNDYNTMAVDAEVTYTTGFAPISVFGSYIANSEGDQKTGLHGGVKVGALKDVGSWFASFVYKDFGRDAFFANYSEPTRSMGGAGLRAMESSVGYQAWQNANVTIAYDNSYHDLTGGGTGEFDVFLLDLNAKF